MKDSWYFLPFTFFVCHKKQLLLHFSLKLVAVKKTVTFLLSQIQPACSDAQQIGSNKLFSQILLCKF